MQVLYLPGFASGPSSTKAHAFRDHFAKQGIKLDALDLRKPSFEHLRLTAMIEYVQSVITGPVVLIGSSLGGLTAARVAERDNRVKAVVLMAPAFHLVDRWREQLGPEWDEWQRTGWREVHDYTTGGSAKIHFGFMEDAIELYKNLIHFEQPALIFHGKNDATVPLDHSRTFAKGKPNVTLIELDDGHQLLDSIPTLLAETDRFLAPYVKAS
jgi:uncharacterized protein